MVALNDAELMETYSKTNSNEAEIRELKEKIRVIELHSKTLREQFSKYQQIMNNRLKRLEARNHVLNQDK